MHMVHITFGSLADREVAQEGGSRVRRHSHGHRTEQDGPPLQLRLR